jgi:hypothetical protein
MVNIGSCLEGALYGEIPASLYVFRHKTLQQHFAGLITRLERPEGKPVSLKADLAVNKPIFVVQFANKM